MAEQPVLGHVSRARLHGPGSALARRIEEQQAALAARAAAARVDDAGPGQRNNAAGPPEDDGEPCRLTWPELWDARLLAGQVAGLLGDGAATGGTSGPPRGSAAAGDPRSTDPRTALERDWIPPWLRSHRQRYKKGPRRQRGAVDALVQYSRRLAAARRPGSASPAPAWGAVSGSHGGGGGGGSPSSGGRGYKRRRSRSLSLIDAAALERPASGLWPGQSVGNEPPWTCVHTWPQAPGDEGDNSPAVCGAPNDALDTACRVCGALRWDGPDGQLVARVSALLQTADLDYTTGRQLAARLRAESGSAADALGVEAAPGELRAVVAHLVGARQQRQQQRRQHQGDGDGGGGSAGVDQFDQEARLQALGCPEAAASIHTSLLTWLEDQRPEAAAAAGAGQSGTEPAAGEQPGQGDGGVADGQQAGAAGDAQGEPLERAAAASAGGALLVLRRLLGRRGGGGSAVGLEGANAVEGPEAVADPRLSLPANYVWAGQELDLALMAHRKQLHQRQQQAEHQQQQLLQAAPDAAAAAPPPSAAPEEHDGRVRCTALRRQLPAGTVAALLDPKASAARAAVRDMAREAAPALPTVTAPTHSWLPAGAAAAAEVVRRRPREAVVMVEVPPSEWVLAETVHARWRLSGGGRGPDGGEWRASWDNVAAVRTHLHRLLSSYRPAPGLEAAWRYAPPWQLAEAAAAYRRDWDAWAAAHQPRDQEEGLGEEGGGIVQGQQQHGRSKAAKAPPRRSARLRERPGSKAAGRGGAQEQRAAKRRKEEPAKKGHTRRQGGAASSSSNDSSSDASSSSDGESSSSSSSSSSDSESSSGSDSSGSESDSESDKKVARVGKKRPAQRKGGGTQDGSESDWQGSSEEAELSDHSGSDSDAGSSGASERARPRRHKRPEGRLVLPGIPDPDACGNGVGGSSGVGPAPGTAWWAELAARLPPVAESAAAIGGSHRSALSPWQPSGPAQQQQQQQQQDVGSGFVAAEALGLPDCVREVLAAARAVGASDAVLARAAARLARLLDDGGGLQQ